MIVYVDMFFLENFIVDMFLLTITAQTLNIKITKKRLIISSTIGALYSFTMIFNLTYFMTSIIFRIIVAALMVYIEFGIKKISFILK
ncbi:sigma-E processing peptidase SpoIIGA, partial [Clostridium oryzae]|uniref:sigma-E processing peptidase SpoIIGA n=1 Tax=Clostridium oryzae TaxID=1450648 RepID=UPI001A9A5F6B